MLNIVDDKLIIVRYNLHSVGLCYKLVEARESF